MSWFLRLGLVAVVVASLAALPACNKSSGPTRPKVAFITNCTAEFWTIGEAGARKAAKEFDVDLDYRQPKTMDVAVQRELIDAVTRTGVSGLAVSVVNPAEESEYLRRISASRPLIAVDNDAPDSGRTFYVGIDNYEAGKAVGRMIQAKLPEGGTIALFIGGTTSANAKARIGGVLDQLAGQKDATGPKYGAFTLYNGEPYTDGADEAKAQQNAKTVIEALKGTPNVALVGLYAYNPKQILLAYRSKRSEVKHPMKIFGFDEDWTTLEGIETGEIEGTVVQNPFLYGYNSVKILATLARGGTIPEDQVKALSVIPYRVVTKEGGPDQEVNGLKFPNPKAADFSKQLKSDIESVGK